METTVKKIYSRNVINIEQSAQLSTANEMMNNYNIRHLPVVNDEAVLVGIISRSDFNGLKFVDSRYNGFTVNQVMSSPVKIVSQTAKVSEVAEIMLSTKISCVLIAKDEEVVGILTTDDLLRLLIETEAMQETLNQLDLEALADEGWISSTITRQNLEI